MVKSDSILLNIRLIYSLYFTSPVSDVFILFNCLNKYFMQQLMIVYIYTLCSLCNMRIKTYI